MSHIATMDPNTGSMVHIEEHKFIVTWLDDVAFLTIGVLGYSYTGIDRIFIPMAEFMSNDPVIFQALRYGLMFGSMLELRRWLETMGIKTDLISYYLDQLFRKLL